MDLRIEIVADNVVCRQDGTKAFAAPLKNFLAALGERIDSAALPEAIPDGVRFVRRRNDVVVVVLEERPQVRTVSWLADESTVPFGKGAVYRTARLAFPFTVAVVAFRNGALTGYQQCFYRTEPLASHSDALLLPNLYNVVDAYGQPCWLCLGNIRPDLTALSWHDKVCEIRRQLWGAGFNRSSEIHEGTSYWTTMKNLDARFAGLAAWEQATTNDPFFPLRVAWRPSGRTVGEVIEGMMAVLAGPQPSTAVQIVQILSLLSSGVLSTSR